MPLPRKALIAVTSAHAPLYPEGKETGVFVSEALHPYKVFREAGLDVDLVSETGKYQADWLSLTKEYLDGEDKKIWEDKSSEFRSKMDNLLKPNDVDPSKVSSHVLDGRRRSPELITTSAMLWEKINRRAVALCDYT